jgi:hypothetical protein
MRNEMVRREKASFFRIGGTAMIIFGLLQLFGVFGR